MKLEPIILTVLLCLSLVHAQSTGFSLNLTLTDPTCFDGILNQDETSIDCGGFCDPCESCVDGLMNQDEIGIDCGGSCDSCEEQGSSGGGGSGGSSSTTVISNINKTLNSTDSASKKYFYVKENETIFVEINNSDSAIYKVELKIKNQKNNITLYIKKIENDLKVEKQIFSNYLFEYVKVSAQNINYEDISNVNVWFKVPKTWVFNQDASFEDIFLINYNGKWEKIKTVYIGEDYTYFYFQSALDNLGYFGIIGQDISEPIDKNNIKLAFKAFIEKPKLTVQDISPLIKFGAVIILTSLILIGSIIFIYKKSHPVIKPKPITKSAKKLQIKKKNKFDDLEKLKKEIEKI
ncbi:PGF-pre-PGF domain-containing protein [archaeon]|nr:PGF-pre-PGF domain-containing protein [archaeon]MBT4022435.1 PGF-pre-PGF domain-containing protein [archaeon]MBT4272589.1 PGF-pre-PGF domain-containing protein [archaeon]MBT4461244.1 PGF-pre-PGF domain-containing protein [archaeon]MBT7440510.1 PGF-pre-PGF domain-containing protein [archaeon]